VPASGFIESIGASWRSMIDLLVLYFVFYSVFRLTRIIRAFRIAALLGVVYSAGVVAWHLDLPIASRVLEGWALILLCLVAIVFQPEIRRALMRVDAFSLFRSTFSADFSNRNQALAEAAFLMAQEKTGALIVILNATPIDDLTDGGVKLNADVSPALICSLFHKASHVHDGAVLIRGNTLLKANIVLPLTERSDVPIAYGTRHRAAMGIAERSDAIAIAVSEQRGEVTVVLGHRTVLVESKQELTWLLAESSRPRKVLSIRWLATDWKLSIAALLVSAIVLGGSAVLSGNSERIVLASIEFDNLAHNLDVAMPGTPRVELENSRQKLVDGLDRCFAARPSPQPQWHGARPP
jgi:diadenylate cyclase